MVEMVHLYLSYNVKKNAMKKWILPLSIAVNFLFTTLLLVTCNKNTNAGTPNEGATNVSHLRSSSLAVQTKNFQTDQGFIPGTSFISLDTANMMISSYIKAIDPTQNPDQIHSLICNADSLVAFYNANPSVRYFKLSFAHNMTYIHNGHYGIMPKPNDNAITMIITGIDASHNYVRSPVGYIIDNLTPCPDQCVSGIAGGDLIQ